MPGAPSSVDIRRGLPMKRTESLIRAGEIFSASKFSRIEQAQNLDNTQTIGIAATISPMVQSRDVANG